MQGNYQIVYAAPPKQSNGGCLICLSVLISLGIAMSLTLGLTYLAFPTGSLSPYMKTNLQSESEVITAFNQFVTNYHRTYTSEAEKRHRFEEFKNNYKKVTKHNAESKDTKVTINQFADLSEGEKSHYHKRLMKRPTIVRESHEQKFSSGGRPPKSIDWVAAGHVTPVGNQGNCGSCWTWSAIGAIEGLYSISQKVPPLDMSKQLILDCVHTKYSEGCEGGDLFDVFEFGMNYGVLTEHDYPYKANVNKCRKTDFKPMFKIQGFRDIPENDSDALFDALRLGPVAVAVDASGFEFQYYSTGNIYIYIYVYRCHKTMFHKSKPRDIACGCGRRRGRDAVLEDQEPIWDMVGG